MGYSQENKRMKDPETQDEMIVGKISIDDLSSMNGFENLIIEEEYKGKADKLSQLTALLDGVNVEAYIGTWCEDSQYNFPQIIALLRQAGYDVNAIKIWGLDRDKKMIDGSAPPNEVLYVPTVIFRRDGTELGRFVENPNKTIIDDFIQILNKK